MDKWTSGAAYDQWMGRWSRLLANEFLTWLALPRGLRWLDICCGSGVVTEAILERNAREREEKANAAAASKTEIGWGHQIRSYVLQPYQMVKDLRTGVQTSDTSGVLDGDLDEFMAATLAQRAFGAPPAAIEDVD